MNGDPEMQWAGFDSIPYIWEVMWSTGYMTGNIRTREDTPKGVLTNLPLPRDYPKDKPPLG